MRKPRSDAAAYREILLSAADSVFSEHGVTAPLDLIVTRAGLGRATLYRNFANRAALMDALLDRTLVSLEEHAVKLQGNGDALFALLEKFGLTIASSAPLVDFWRAVDRDDEIVRAARVRIGKIFKEPLQSAIDAGLCKPDLTLADVHLMVHMLGASLRGKTSTDRRALARRALQLIRTGADSSCSEAPSRALKKLEPKTNQKPDRKVNSIKE